MTKDFLHKILIVDDEKSVGKSLGRILMAEDIDFVYVESGELALEEIKSAKKPFSLIISDQRMPGMQGTDLLEQAKKINPDTIRFLLTAYLDLDIILKSVNKGAVQKFINKPWDNDELLELIKIYLRQYEKIIEGKSLLKTAKKQNKKLYDFNCEFMEITTMHNKRLAELNMQIQKLEKQIQDKPAQLEDFSIQFVKQLEESYFQGDKPDPENINKFYAYCINDLFNEFEELANRNGFEMPAIMTGGTDD